VSFGVDKKAFGHIHIFLQFTHLPDKFPSRMDSEDERFR
jgi:hypothetical protein